MTINVPAPSGGIYHSISPIALKGLKKIPCLKNKLSTPQGEATAKKVIYVAVEIFKASGIIFAGALFGALSGMGFGIVPLCISIAAGGLLAGISYFGAKGVMAVITKYGYPANKHLKEKALSLDTWVNQKNEKIFTDTLKTFEEKEWFKQWLALKGYKKCNNFLWRRFQKNVSFGECQALIQLVQAHSSATAKELLDKLSVKKIFRKQILEIISADFHSIIQNNIDSARKRGAELEYIQGIEIESLHKHLIGPTQEAFAIQGARKQPSCHFNQSRLLNFSLFKPHFDDYLTQLKEKNPNKNFAGIIRLEGSKPTHTLFIQYSRKEKHYRFYDPYHPRFTGFYEFSEEEALLEGLHQHLRAYAKFPSISLRAYQKAEFTLYSLRSPRVKKEDSTVQTPSVSQPS